MFARISVIRIVEKAVIFMVFREVLKKKYFFSSFFSALALRGRINTYTSMGGRGAAVPG